MWRGLLAGLLTQLLLPAAVHIYPSLPNGAQPNCVQVDSAGNIFVGGVVKGDAFVAKISSDGSSILYWTVFGGADTDSVQALALGSDGSAYITGNTLSTD